MKLLRNKLCRRRYRIQTRVKWWMVGIGLSRLWKKDHDRKKRKKANPL
ncbi:MAG: hypothetical protein ABID09_00435 [Candidatus Omnitrophota bacterium]